MTTPFRRKDNALYNIQQRFADEKIPSCPICGTGDPHWSVAENQKIFYKYYYFRCEKCGSILETTEEDVCGISKTTKTLAGKMKKHNGKDLETIYIKVQRLGTGFADMDRIALQGKELALEDLLAVGRKLQEGRE